MTPEQEEIVRLNTEIAKLKSENAALQKAAAKVAAEEREAAAQIVEDASFVWAGSRTAIADSIRNRK